MSFPRDDITVVTDAGLYPLGFHPYIILEICFLSTRAAIILRATRPWKYISRREEYHVRGISAIATKSVQSFGLAMYPALKSIERQNRDIFCLFTELDRGQNSAVESPPWNLFSAQPPTTSRYVPFQKQTVSRRDSASNSFR